MGKKAPKAPAAPDPAAAAQAQGAANVDAAVASGLMNMVNQNTPYGNLQYTQSGTQRVGSGDTARDIPIYSATTTLSPAEQRQLDLTNQINEQALNFGQGQLGQVQNALKDPISFNGLPNINRDTSADRQRVEDAVYRRMTGRLDDRFGRDQASIENRLANQGIAQGSEAYTNALKDFNYGKNDAYQSAADQAILAGGQEQNRLFGLDMQGRQQGIQERSLQRSQPVNELATMLGFGGGVQTPQFSTGGTGANVQPVDYAGLMNNQYNAQMNNYNARMGQRNAAMNGLFGLGSAAIGLL